MTAWKQASRKREHRVAICVCFVPTLLEPRTDNLFFFKRAASVEVATKNNTTRARPSDLKREKCMMICLALGEVGKREKALKM